VLDAASLMVAAPAAADAVRRAKAMPDLRVGLHLVVIDGPAVLPHESLPDLTDKGGRFPRDQLGLALRYAFSPTARRQLAAEIRAQFTAFAATGLPLGHADAHKHMHLHPTVGRLMLAVGREYGLQRIRVPAEPPGILNALGYRPTAGDRALYAWSRVLRYQARRARIGVNDHLFGLVWTGHMTTVRVRALFEALPDGDSEIYFHPATRRDRMLSALMPDYEHEAELAALLDPEIRALVRGEAVQAVKRPNPN
jgi:hopanoid biosynthesis associated protein HpnK